MPDNLDNVAPQSIRRRGAPDYSASRRAFDDTIINTCVTEI
jgi:hypothetical protein